MLKCYDIQPEGASIDSLVEHLARMSKIQRKFFCSELVQKWPTLADDLCSDINYFLIDEDNDNGLQAK